MDLNSVLLLAAVSGYGDVVDGYPSWDERAVHLWTNAARVDPQAFNDEYNNAYQPCDVSIDFQSEERIPTAPLYYTPPLNESARFHSQDMSDNSWFDHNSSDGTPFPDRVSRFYTDSGMVGENIAMGYPSAYDTVFKGWMCSAGHRQNIMTAGYVELGTGVVTSYYTQNFGGGEADSASPVRMGLHHPEKPEQAELTTFYADYEGTGLITLDVWVDGKPESMALLYGEAEMGVYVAEKNLSRSGCSEYYFEVVDDSGSYLIPEDGSWLGGKTCDGLWVEGHKGKDIDLDPETMLDDVYLIGCSSTGTRGGLMALAMFGLLALRRTS